MLMSHGEISAGAIGCPNLAVCADAANEEATRSVAHTARHLSVDIARLPFLIDAPAGDGVVVIEAAQSAGGDKLVARRLYHAGAVDGAALQHGGTAVPLPRGTKAHRRLGQVRALQ